MVKRSQHFFLRQDLDGTASSFTQNIDIPFQPNRMIVHYCVFYYDPNASPADPTGITLIRCPELIRNGEGYLSLFSTSNFNVPSIFEINESVSGIYTFDLLTIAGALDSSRIGSLVMDLEFVEDN